MFCVDEEEAGKEVAKPQICGTPPNVLAYSSFQERGWNRA